VLLERVLEQGLELELVLQRVLEQCLLDRKQEQHSHLGFL